MSIGKEKMPILITILFNCGSNFDQLCSLGCLRRVWFVKNKLKVFTDLRNIAGSKYTEISGFNTLGFNGNGGIRFTF